MTDPATETPLATRAGLSGDIAYLRAAYPRKLWRDHANYGELAAFWLQIHDGLRGHGEHLTKLTLAFREGGMDAADFQRMFVPGLNQFLQHLVGHHQIEDRAYFPRFRALDPRMIAGFAILESDHEIIHEALLASADSARALLTGLAGGRDDQRTAADAYTARFDHLLALLLRHLADEEELVIPAMLEHGEHSLS